MTGFVTDRSSFSIGGWTAPPRQGLALGGRTGLTRHKSDQPPDRNNVTVDCRNQRMHSLQETLRFFQVTVVFVKVRKDMHVLPKIFVINNCHESGYLFPNNKDLFN